MKNDFDMILGSWGWSYPFSDTGNCAECFYMSEKFDILSISVAEFILAIRNEGTHTIPQFSLVESCDRKCWQEEGWYTLRKILKFHLITWSENFVETYSFHWVSNISSENLRKIGVSTEFPHQEIRRNRANLWSDKSHSDITIL